MTLFNLRAAQDLADDKPRFLLQKALIIWASDCNLPDNRARIGKSRHLQAAIHCQTLIAALAFER